MDGGESLADASVDGLIERAEAAQLDEPVRDLVLAACLGRDELAGAIGGTPPPADRVAAGAGATVEANPIFLSSITVAGVRGIAGDSSGAATAGAAGAGEGGAAGAGRRAQRSPAGASRAAPGGRGSRSSSGAAARASRASPRPPSSPSTAPPGAGRTGRRPTRAGGRTCTTTGRAYGIALAPHNPQGPISTAASIAQPDQARCEDRRAALVVLERARQGDPRQRERGRAAAPARHDRDRWAHPIHAHLLGRVVHRPRLGARPQVQPRQRGVGDRSHVRRRRDPRPKRRTAVCHQHVRAGGANPGRAGTRPRAAGSPHGTVDLAQPRAQGGDGQSGAPPDTAALATAAGTAAGASRPDREHGGRGCGNSTRSLRRHAPPSQVAEMGGDARRQSMTARTRPAQSSDASAHPRAVMTGSCQ